MKKILEKLIKALDALIKKVKKSLEKDKDNRDLKERLRKYEQDKTRYASELSKLG